MQPHTPVGGLIKGSDPGECQRQPVEDTPGIGTGPGGGVAADHPLGVDKAALDFCFWPARCDRGGDPRPPSMTAMGGAGIGSISRR